MATRRCAPSCASSSAAWATSSAGPTASSAASRSHADRGDAGGVGGWSGSRGGRSGIRSVRIGWADRTNHPVHALPRPLPDVASLARHRHRRRAARDPGHVRHDPARLLGGAGRHHLATRDARSGSPTWNRSSGRAPASSRSRWATTRSSATTSRSRHANAALVPGRLHPQADAGQRRALHHARAEGIRVAGAERGGAHPGVEGRLFRQVLAQLGKSRRRGS